VAGRLSKRAPPHPPLSRVIACSGTVILALAAFLSVISARPASRAAFAGGGGLGPPPPLQGMTA